MKIKEFGRRIIDVLTCPSCGGNRFRCDQNAEDQYCIKCGLVL